MKSFTKSILLLSVSTFALVAFAAQQIDTSKWQSFSSKDGSFKIKAPQGWTIGDSNDETFKAGMEKIKVNNPNLAKSMATGLDQYDLYLMDFTDLTGKNVSNMNLKVLKDSGLTDKMYPDVAKAILAEAKLKKSGWKVINMPSGKTLTYWGILPVALGEGESIDVSTFGHMIVKGNMVYIYTLTTPTAAEKAQKPVIEAMAKTVTLK